jgi:rhodanese-related sulfurtransferase
MMRKSMFISVVVFFLLVFLYGGTGGVAVSAGKRPLLKSIDVDEVAELIEENKDNPDFIILDIRTPEEYESGHLENAINIDFYSDSFHHELDKLDKNKVYLEYCRSGSRSSRTLDLMKELGFSEVYELQDGITSWIEKGYPIVK